MSLSGRHCQASDSFFMCWQIDRREACHLSCTITLVVFAVGTKAPIGALSPTLELG